MSDSFDSTASVEKALLKASENPKNDMTPRDVSSVAPVVAKEVNKNVNAIITNLNNQEPWYQSRVIIGAGVSLLSQLCKVAGVQLDIIDNQEDMIQLVMDALSLAGVAFALYGRLTVQKPMGQ